MSLFVQCALSFVFSASFFASLIFCDWSYLTTWALLTHAFIFLVRGAASLIPRWKSVYGFIEDYGLKAGLALGIGVGVSVTFVLDETIHTFVDESRSCGGLLTAHAAMHFAPVVAYAVVTPAVVNRTPMMMTSNDRWLADDVLAVICLSSLTPLLYTIPFDPNSIYELHSKLKTDGAFGLFVLGVLFVALVKVDKASHR